MKNPSADLTIDLVEIDDVAQVEERIRSRLRGYVSDFRIIVRGGSVFLSGRARSYYAKQLAQQDVMAFIRLPIQGNEIRVE
jgi:hypothetical protein